MIVKVEEILGYYIGEELVCTECIDEETEQEVTAEQIVFDHPTSGVRREEEMGFCDQCKKRLW